MFANKSAGFSYSRIGNPTVDAFEKRVCELDGGLAAVACSSGMSAITAALLNVLQAGDEIIAGAGLFGGTLDLFRDLEAFGITTRFVPRVKAAEISHQLTEKTKLIFGEVISNPGLDVMDIEQVAELAHANSIPLFVDATTATPYLVNPIKLGADVLIHSSSKYINGSGNSLSGVIVDSGKFRWNTDKFPVLAEYAKFGNFAFTTRLRGDTWRNTGGCLSPMNAYLNIIGIETLGLRMQRICDNALALARMLEQTEGVTVNYPALSSSVCFPLVQKQLRGLGGGIVTVRAGSKERAYKLMNSLKYALNATNIGDTKTLVIHPASTIFLHSTEQARQSAGVYDDLIRVSVGIEDESDIIEDFTRAIHNLD